VYKNDKINPQRERREISIYKQCIYIYNKIVNTQLVSYRERKRTRIVTQTKMATGTKPWHDDNVVYREGPYRHGIHMSYSWSNWDLCRAWRARSLCFRRPTESFSWYNHVVVLSRYRVNCVNSVWVQAGVESFPSWKL